MKIRVCAWLLLCMMVCGQMAQAAPSEGFPEGTVFVEGTGDIPLRALALPDGGIFVTGHANYTEAYRKAHGVAGAEIDLMLPNAEKPAMHSFAAAYDADGTLRWRTVLDMHDGYNYLWASDIHKDGRVKAYNHTPAIKEMMPYLFDSHGNAEPYPEIDVLTADDVGTARRWDIGYEMVDGRECIWIAWWDGEQGAAYKRLLDEEELAHFVHSGSAMAADGESLYVYGRLWNKGAAVGEHDNDGIIIKMNWKGELLYVYRDTYDKNRISDIIPLDSGDIIAVNRDTSGGWIRRFDANGNVQWRVGSDTYRGQGVNLWDDYDVNRTSYIEPYKDGFVIVGARYWQEKEKGIDYYVMRFSMDGEPQGMFLLQYSKDRPTPPYSTANDQGDVYVYDTYKNGEDEDMDYFFLKVTDDMFRPMEEMKREPRPRPTSQK